jgi:hypothetical protein
MKRGHWERPPAWLVLGLALVLLSGPIGNWYNFVTETVESLIVSGYDFRTSDGADRFPGWLALLAGWCCIAHALGGARKPPSDLPAGFARLRFRLRWLPVPILATLGSYVVLAFHSPPPLLLRVDVQNAPPGLTLHGRAIVTRYARRQSHYRATVDALLGVQPPPFDVKYSFSEAHSEHRFAAGRLSLLNWQPDLESVFLGVEDETQHKVAFLTLSIERHHQHTESTIRVTRQSLQPCSAFSALSEGACLSQVTSGSRDEREIHVVFDLADIELKPYKEKPFCRSGDIL